MKKIIIFLTVAMSLFVYLGKSNAGEALIIPDQAIRLRVIPNSDTAEDQYTKQQVSIALQQQLYKLLKDTEKISDARIKIEQNLSLFDQSVQTTLSNLNQQISYEISFGQHDFPEKEYKGVLYPAGEYESLIITLGSGAGDNWWCVLFPPLCLLEAEESDEVEYKFFVKELIDKYF